MRILQLPSAVANQIAAGEVIERPASIVKELIENSLDANADTINIEIGYGGINQIRISDNGLGIVADDLPLAIAAHATSKITQLADLYAITSMGFRGEALASIASISRFTISSKTVTQAQGMRLENHNPSQLIVHPRSEGTTVEACDIFYNAPVRKKFLKTERVEYQAIDMIVRRFALSAPTIAINLFHNGKQQLHLPAAREDYSYLQRISKLMGKSFIDNAMYFEVSHADINLYGYVSGANYQRSQNDKLWTYVNGRIVKDKLINHAIKQAYGDFLYPGRYPSCILYLNLNPAEVDVNVHPTKHEVRFQQPRLIHDFITTQIQKILNKPQFFPKYELKNEIQVLQVKENKLSIHPFATTFIEKNDHPSFVNLEKIRSINDGSKSVSTENIGNKKFIPINEQHALVFLENTAYLVDLIALHQRWLIAHLQMEIAALPSRNLLVPIYYELDDLIAQPWSVVQPLLKKAGLEVQKSTANTLKICSIPTQIPDLDIHLFLTKFFSSPSFTEQEIVTLLAASQCYNSVQLDTELGDELYNYLQASIFETRENSTTTILKPLSVQNCQDYLHAK